MAKRDHLLHKVLGIRHLNSTTFVLRIERKDIIFTPGQHVSVGPANDLNMREYSIYSSLQDDYLEIIVKEVKDGYVSPRLKELKPGNLVYVEGPFGFFTLPKDFNTQPLLFVASGTGISPFRSFVRTYPDLDYTLIHGVRSCDERYEHADFVRHAPISCVSREDGGNFRGRVTGYIRSQEFSPLTKAYLCGNCDMIYEVYDILCQKGLVAENIAAEVYF